MEYNYALTASYDGKLYHTLRSSDLEVIIDSWNKYKDSGDAKKYATYNLTDLSGKTISKTFEVVA